MLYLSISVIQRSIGSLQEELSGSVNQRLTVTDAAIKDGINKLISLKVSASLLPRCH